jgi:hypothetical protein
VFRIIDSSSEHFIGAVKMMSSADAPWRTAGPEAKEVALRDPPPFLSNAAHTFASPVKAPPTPEGFVLLELCIID